MSVNDDAEEQFLDLMAACDDALAAGKPAEATDSTTKLQSELQPRLQRDLACLHRLRRVLSRPVPSPALPWTSLGRFELRGELGRGGMGVVYLAYDPLLGREVALKVPRVEMATAPEQRQRFHREARAAAGLDHPNIVPVHEAGEVGPVCFLVSAYCPGITLAEWLKRRTEPVPFSDAATLVATLADAVQHAHERGVVHRDLKPANILLSFSREPPASASAPARSFSRAGADALAGGSRLNEASPKITDFGLAKLFRETSGSGQTQSGAIVGTACYMAPEQAEGGRRHVGPAADIYSLGVLLYELLTGWPPFRGDTDLEVLQQVLRDDPPPPSRLRPGLPLDLGTICLKCLEKESQRRYADAGLVADDLRCFLANRPIHARRPTLPDRAGKWARRHRPVVWSVAVSGVAVVTLALVGLTVSNVRIRSEAFQKELALEEARSNHERAEERRREAEVRRKEAYDNFMLAVKAVDDYGIKVAGNPRLQAHDLRELRATLLQSAVEFYRQFVTQRGEDPTLQVELARAYRRMAALVTEMGDLDRSIASLQESVKILTPLLANDPTDLVVWQGFMEGLIRLGSLYRGTTRLAQAEEVYRKALQVPAPLLEKHGKDPSVLQLRAACLVNLGNVYFDTGRTEQAEEAYHAAQTIQQKLVQDCPDDPRHALDLANSHNSMGVQQRQHRKFDRAAAELERAVVITRRLSQAHPDAFDYQKILALSCNNLGMVHILLKNWSQAEAAYQEAVTSLEHFVKEHASVTDAQRLLGVAYNRLAMLYYELGQAVPAERELARARAILEPFVERYPNATDLAISQAYCEQGCGMMARELREEPEAAYPWFTRAIRRCEVVLRQDPRQYSARTYRLQSLAGRAQCLTEMGRHAEALADWRLALEPDADKNSTFRAGYARALAAAGDLATAVAEAAEAAADKGLAAESCFDLGCAYAMCAGPLAPGPLREDYASRAVALLARPRAGGYFERPNRVNHLHREKALDPIRQREDFRRLLDVVPAFESGEGPSS